jgi:two-component system, sensor histidine kinase and response regulator
MKIERPKILLVDDVEANLVALEAQLSRLNCEVLRARSGNEALSFLLKHEVAVMLLDVQMPEMDGYEVARLARENPATSEIPIVFVTAMNETEENALKGYGAGAVDFLFKPINPQVLSSKVQVFLELYLGKRRLADEIAAHRATLAELEAFNFSVSHDLRAPLRPLLGFSQALLEDLREKVDPKSADYLRRIQAAATRMSQLIDDLLLLSRMGRGGLQRNALDLVPLAASVVEELRRNDPARSPHVTYTSVPSAPAIGDSRLLKIVFENLLRNAWKFSQKTDRAHIELGMRQESGTTVYFVKDNGAGFDSAFADRLFQPFRRLHSDAEFEGTGIGLAIVQRIVRRHGGRVWAEGAPGKGATVSFSLGGP